jgi:hypothetical protein
MNECGCIRHGAGENMNRLKKKEYPDDYFILRLSLFIHDGGI